MNINDINIGKFICGEPLSEEKIVLSKMLEGENVGASYADMMRYRVADKAAEQCIDTYYVAHKDGKAYSRLWNGWGRHESAIGNFGNFVTLEELRGQGIGHKMLKKWYEDITSRDDLPLCLLCMGDKRASKLYFPYGFKTIENGASFGPLFMPLGDTPTDFEEFCEIYYQPSDVLIRRPATVEWRHEIDCLLKYALWSMGLEHTINGIYLEQALLYSPGKAKLLFTERNRCVGWELDGILQVHPQYKSSVILP